MIPMERMTCDFHGWALTDCGERCQVKRLYLGLQQAEDHVRRLRARLVVEHDFDAKYSGACDPAKCVTAQLLLEIPAP